MAEINDLEKESIKDQVSSGLEEAKRFAQTLNFDEVKSGEWFISLLKMVIHAYNRNASAEFFRQKYPGLSPDEIADKLISVQVRYAAIAGALAGAATTANQVAVLGSVGMTAALFAGTIGTEMVCLTHIQMRLVLDLSVVYDLQLDPEDPEDVLMIFGYALGVTPTELVGKGLQIVAGAGAKGAVRKYISKGTLKAIQDFGRRLGLKILQRTILKYVIPGVSAAVGSGYNYMTTQAVGRIAKTHFKSRGKATDELRVLVSRQNTYDLAFPAAAMYMAKIDGQFSLKEKEFYRAMLSRMSFDEHTQAEFQRLIANEETILEAIAQIDDDEVRQSLMEILALMATYDGKLTAGESRFLVNAAECLGVPLDLEEVAHRTQDYQVVVRANIFEKATQTASGAAAIAIAVAGQTAGGVKDTAAETSEKVKGALGKVLKRAKDVGEEEIAPPEKAMRVCTNCGEENSADYRFCPSCGNPAA